MSDTPFPEVTFVETVVKTLVKNPEVVIVERVVDDRGILLTLTVSKDDMGTIIGKGGQMISAIRILTKILSAKANKSICIKVNDIPTP